MAGIRGRTGAARGFLGDLTGAAGVILQFHAISCLTCFLLCEKMDLTGTAEPDGIQGQQSIGSAPDGRAAGRGQSRGGRTLCGRKREADGRRTTVKRGSGDAARAQDGSGRRTINRARGGESFSVESRSAGLLQIGAGIAKAAIWGGACGLEIPTD